ncbi:MAG: gamma-glutamyltransferase [Halioglobus sp.]|nr:gamma-glutamyltransferase [Halioglobus sp.]|tara:strand:- start:971 stop:2716 length:1746 start_codon:yes stop_codon:yes gene_type:complete
MCSARIAPFVLLLIVAVCPLPRAWAQPPAEAAPIIDYRQRFVPVAGRQGMVVGPEKLATEIGLQVLREGGNAVDAAVATGFALAVTYPRAGNLGGGGFMLIHRAGDARQTFIDYREMAPATAAQDLFIDESGKVDKLREYFSHQSAGVPGTVAGLLYALEKYGTISRERALAPAIALARDGIEVSFALHFELAARAHQLRRNAEAARLFLDEDGNARAMGSSWRQQDLAWTLEQIARKGRAGFYAGEVARRIDSEMRRGGGLITAADLAAYEVVEREPVRGRYRGFEVVSAPPPSSGGIHIVQMLNILEGFDLAAMGHNSAAYLHHLAESMKLAYADRSRYLGDPDFVDVPTAQLTDKAYAARQRALIRPDRATPAVQIAPGRLLGGESTDTTHYTVADRFGNVVSNTYTLNFSFGSHIAVPGTGMLLNNEMADFAAQPGQANAFGLVQGEANRIEPRKRPLSSMSPTIVLRDGRPWLATGSPGGSVIINTVLQTVLNAADFDMNIAAAAAAPRVHHQWQPDTLRVEEGVSVDTLALLRAMGHPVEVAQRTQGRTNSIMLRDGWLLGATDARRPGGAVATY